MSAVPVAGVVVGVCAGKASRITTGRRPIASAFVKTPLDGPVRLGRLGLSGDEHVYHDHGGPDMAVLLYSREHYAAWRGLGLDLPELGALGENLTVEGRLTEHDVCVGDVLAVGGAVVEVCQPRSPCYKIAARYGRKDLAVIAQSTGAMGYLARVREEGDVRAGDAVRLVERVSAITLAEAGRILDVDRHDLDGARRLLALPSLGSSTRRKLEQRLAARGEHGLDQERLFHEDALGA